MARKRKFWVMRFDGIWITVSRHTTRELASAKAAALSEQQGIKHYVMDMRAQTVGERKVK